MLKSVDGKQDRIKIEAWVAPGGAGIESTICVYPCVCRPADSICPAQEVQKCVQIVLSKPLKDLLLSEVDAAIAALKA